MYSLILVIVPISLLMLLLQLPLYETVHYDDLSREVLYSIRVLVPKISFDTVKVEQSHGDE